MCDPLTVMASAGLAIEVAGAVTENQAKKKAARANATAADASAKQAVSQISLRQNQEQDATDQTIMQADRATRQADAQARVNAGEAGVAGASVDALLADITNKDSAFKVSAQTNLGNTLDQLNQQKVGARVQAANQKAAVPFPSDFATGLQIGGDVLNFGADLINRRPTPGKG